MSSCAADEPPISTDTCHSLILRASQGSPGLAGRCAQERYEVVSPARATASVGLIAYAAVLAQMHVSICAPPASGGYVARVVIDVMLKTEIHDPQGDAIADSARRLGYGEIASVRQGKRFEVEIDGPADDAALDQAAKLAADLLANPVIEEFSVRHG
jgi:phosphoribosylformylglycinamidine synthase subunit PurS